MQYRASSLAARADAHHLSKLGSAPAGSQPAGGQSVEIGCPRLHCKAVALRTGGQLIGPAPALGKPAASVARGGRWRGDQTHASWQAAEICCRTGALFGREAFRNRPHHCVFSAAIGKDIELCQQIAITGASQRREGGYALALRAVATDAGSHRRWFARPRQLFTNFGLPATVDAVFLLQEWLRRHWRPGS